MDAVTPSWRTGEGPLRIAFRVGQYPTLSETFVTGQMAGLVARGHAVSVLADTAGPARGTAGPLPGMRRLRVVAPRGRVASWAFARLPYRLRRGLAAAYERRACAVSDVVLCNFGWFGVSVADAVAGRPRRAAVVTIFHGDDMSRMLRNAPQGVYDGVFAQSDLLLPVSDFWYRRLAEMGAPESRMAVHRMGVDLEDYAFVPRDDVPRSVLRLLTVGRLVEKKGTRYLLQALARLRDEHPHLAFELRVVGDGPLEAGLKQLTAELGLGGRVAFLGALPHGRIADELRQADLFVLPSVTARDGDMEGVPVSLMEAMASGVPVVSTRHSGIPELVAHETSGRLAAERDARDLAAQIGLMASAPRMRRRCADAARRTVEREFDNARLHDALERRLREVARRRAQVRGPVRPLGAPC